MVVAVGIAAAATVASGALQASAAGDAADTQASAADRATAGQLQATKLSIAAQQQAQEQARADQAPWRSVGQTALQQIADLYGIGAVTTPGGGSTPVAATAYNQPSNALLQGASNPNNIDWAAYRNSPGGQNAVDQFNYERKSIAKGKGDYPDLQGFLEHNLSLDPNKDNYLTASAKAAMAQGGSGAQTQEVATGSNTSADNRTAQQRQADALAAFQTSPSYQFRLQQGLKDLETSAAARGNLISGDQLKAITNYGQGLASTEYNSYVDRLSQLAGYGANAATNTANQAVQTGANVGQTITSGAAQAGQDIQNAGLARASGYAGTANAWGNTLSGLGTIAGQYAASQPTTQTDNQLNFYAGTRTIPNLATG